MKKDKLLIVDDEEVIAGYYSKHLEKYDFDISLAADGRQAVELAEALKPDLVLLDIRLPVLDGFEVMEEFRKRDIRTRIIMFSAYMCDLNTAIRCIRSGACDFVTKPFVDVPELANRIKKYILVESTINVQIADTNPIVNELIRHSEALTRRIESLKDENAKLNKRRVSFDILAKCFYIILSLISIGTLYKIGILERGLTVGLLFVLLFLLLMVPIDRMQQISAQLSKLKARIVLKDPDREGTRTNKAKRPSIHS